MDNQSQGEANTNGSPDQLIQLEMLAEEMHEWALKVFAIAAEDAESPRQSATLAREASSIARTYATMVMAIERCREKRAKGN